MNIKKRLRQAIEPKCQSPLVGINAPVLADEVETSFRGICVREPVLPDARGDGSEEEVELL